MTLVDRHSVDTDGAIKAVALDVLLGTIVALFAERLQFAELEQDWVAAMRHNMVHGVGDDVATLR
jgi:hypothetical protein